MITQLKAGRFVEQWRRRKSAAFDLTLNSTTGGTVDFLLWGGPVSIYSNANLSIYSAQSCNARCSFCVEELRPASRGTDLTRQKSIQRNDEPYFEALDSTLQALRPLNPSVSVTGGEASKDPRLPRILRTLADHNMRKRTMTTNGSGLLDVRDGDSVIAWIVNTGVSYLNVSRAHPCRDENSRIMKLADGLTDVQLQEVVRIAAAGGTRVRLSCVLLHEAVNSLGEVIDYLDFASRLGVDNVIFRQLMKTDATTHLRNHVVDYSDRQRVALEPLLDQISTDPRFQFQRQIMGYYYYVEVWKYRNIDVVFEEADLAQLEAVKRASPEVIHELVFHPNACLASTWQPWDGILGPNSSPK